VLNFLNHLVDLLGTNPSLTPWLLLIILFVLAAMAVARVGKIALSNVDTMMQQGEAQRERLEKEINRKDDIIAARDKRIAELEDDQQTTITFVTGLRREQAELHDKIFELERTNRGLVHDYQRALEQLEDRK
jgi:Skp family chaperone for outer membrane proteins